MLKAISLYTGVGGLDFGLEAAGIKTAVALELDAASCRTLRLNRPHWPVIEGDIDDISSKTILKAAGLRKRKADLLVAGPPCQPFSKSSYWLNGDARRMKDPRADTLRGFLRVLRDTLPRVFLIENVQGLAYEGKSEGLNVLVRGIKRINRETGSRYSIAYTVLNAADFGVPQTRERVFIIGSRDGKVFTFPSPTHAKRTDAAAARAGLKPFHTAWDAIGDLRSRASEPGLEVNGHWGSLLPSIPEGRNYLWHTSRGGGKRLFGWRTRYWSFLLKLAKDRPAWTLQAQPGNYVGPFHWNNRRLTVKEMCRLQTFPPDLKFDSSRNEIQCMLGNAVPSLLAEILAREIRRQLLGSTVRKDLQLSIARRTRTPGPERVGRMPNRYKKLIGKHEDHPGEGRGIGAVRRKRNEARKKRGRAKKLD